MRLHVCFPSMKDESWWCVGIIGSVEVERQVLQRLAGRVRARVELLPLHLGDDCWYKLRACRA